MRRLAFAVASFALFAGTSAVAQITNIQSSAESAFFIPGTFCTSSACTQKVGLGPGAGRYPGSDVSTVAGANYNSYVDVTGDTITFESSHSVSQGQFNSFQSSSVVSFEFDTDTESNFHSEIIPQGLGIYMADTSGGCLFSNSCAQVSDQLYTFADLSPLGSATTGIVAGVGFSFEILHNGTPFYQLDGTMFLQINPDCDNGFCIIESLTMPDGESAEDVLNGFAQQTHPLDYSARAYGWGSTEVGIGLGTGHHTFEYRTSVFSFANADCAGPTQNICLVAYSGFGDPIGRGGAIDSLSAFDVGSLEHQGGPEGLITGLDFSPAVFRLRFDGDGLVYASPQGSVPEPGAWALLIMGFGAMGAALRRRRIPAHI